MYIPTFKRYSQSELEYLLKKEKEWINIEDVFKNPKKYFTEDDFKNDTCQINIGSNIITRTHNGVTTLVENSKKFKYNNLNITMDKDSIKRCYIKHVNNRWYERSGIVIPNYENAFRFDYLRLNMTKFKLPTFVCVGGVTMASIYLLKD